MTAYCTIEAAEIMNRLGNAVDADHVMKILIYVVMYHPFDKICVEAMSKRGELVRSFQRCN